jgi:hypothetical protein
MHTLRRLMVITGILASNLLSAVITFDVSVVGTTGSGETLYRYNYSVQGLTVPQNTEIDIRFDPALYGMLLNGVAPAGFDLLLLQPNNPPGAFGDYSALALVNNPSLAGPFSVDFTFIGPGTPGAQPFFINLIDPISGAITPIDQGFTTPAGGAVVPEPGTMVFGSAALLMTVLTRAAARRKRGRAVSAGV